MQWHTTPGFVPRAWFRSQWGEVLRPLYYTKHRLTQRIDEYVCNFGQRTGYGCGRIRSKNFSGLPYIDNASPTFIYVQKTYEPGGTFIARGDSGGPWFNGNTAYGIQSGGDYDEAAYMAITPYIYDLRLVPLIAPH